MEEEQSFEIPVRKLHSKQGRRSRRTSGRINRSVVDYINIVHATGRTIYLITESISLEIRIANQQRRGIHGIWRWARSPRR
jgi:hypothetical protein